VRNRFHFIALVLPFLTLAVPAPARAQWGYPPYGAYRYLQPESHLRIAVKPSDASVYVDGYFAGKVDDFDGRMQRLHVPPGEHEITVYLEGYRSLTQRLYLSPNATRTLEGTLEKLGPGAPPEPKPEPLERDRDRDRYQADAEDELYGRPPMRGPRGPVEPPQRRQPGVGVRESRYASLSIRVRPAGAVVLIDGERWDGPDGDERLIVQVAEGRHVIEVEREGYEPFTTEVEVRRGETAPVNITLRRR